MGALKQGAAYWLRYFWPGVADVKVGEAMAAWEACMEGLAAVWRFERVSGELIGVACIIICN